VIFTDAMSCSRLEQAAVSHSATDDLAFYTGNTSQFLFVLT